MEGMFSTVEKQVLETRLVAVKKYKKHHGQLVQRHYQRELWALRTMSLESEAEARENHVICLLSADSTGGAHYLTFPYYEYTLMNFVEDRDRQFALSALYQIAQGLIFLHSQGIVHCDLAPTNILVDHDQQVVIADFGCAHLYSSSTTYPDSGFNSMEEIGTRYYKAPEHLFGYRVYQPATDIWSLGTISCHLLLGHPIFDGQSDLEQIGMIVRSLGPPPIEVKEEEMSMYPDIDKLIFFGGDSLLSQQDSDDDDSGGSDEDDEVDAAEEETLHGESVQANIAKMPNAKSLSLGSILNESFVAREDQVLIRRMLTWSIKERITAKEISKLVYPVQ